LILPILNVSYKPQKISPKFFGTVHELLNARIQEAYKHPQFKIDVLKPLNIQNIVDLQVQNLSGGELQRVALVICLGKPADVYLIDEPSAYLGNVKKFCLYKNMQKYHEKLFIDFNITNFVLFFKMPNNAFIQQK
jgi:ATP-binding cassette subfamily E protein 1